MGSHSTSHKGIQQPGNKLLLIPKVTDQAATEAVLFFCLGMHLASTSREVVGEPQKRSANLQKTSQPSLLPSWNQQPLPAAEMLKEKCFSGNILSNSPPYHYSLPDRVNVGVGVFSSLVFITLLQWLFKTHSSISSLQILILKKIAKERVLC